MDDITPKLEARLMQETKVDLITIMLEALSIMEGFNGNTIQECVVDALGGTTTETTKGIVHSYPKYKKQ